jgi:hypothetical protein
MFLFEQTVLEDKQGTLVTVPTPVTEAEMEEQFSQYMSDSIRLQTAMVKADRKCTENYLEVTTESDKEAIKAIFEATVTDFIKKSKDSIVKAVQTVINWLKEKVKMITTKLADKVKEIAKKMKELSPDIIGAMDKVEVETIDFNETKAVYDDEFIKIIKEVDVIRASKDIDEVKEISENLSGYIRNRKWGNGEPDKDLEVVKVPFGKVKSRFAHHCSIEGIKKYSKDCENGVQFLASIENAINSISMDSGALGAKKIAALSKISRITRHYIQSRLTLHTRIIAYAIKGTLKAIALAPKNLVKKEATKESVSLLDDMLASF